MEKTYLISKEQYLIAKANWTKKSNHNSTEIIIYNLLRSKPLDSGFCEKKRAIQRNDPWYAFNQAISKARWWIQQPAFMKATFGFDAPAEFKDLIKV